MKVSLLLLVALVALATGATIPADKVFLQKQFDVLRLMHRVHQHNLIPEQVTVGDSYDIEANINHYKHPRVVKNFMALYKKDHVKRGEPFSTYYNKHREQAIMLFELFYYANDYDTFYKTACWARDRVNEGMYLYSFSIAVMHREDMHDIVLPPFYEVYPFLFVEDDVIQKAYDYKMKESGHDNQPHTHVIPVNFTLHNQEQKLSYFTEDVFLNAFNTYYRYMYPTWFNYTKYEYDVPRHGEQFYYFYQQIFARYVLERYSNDMPDLEPFKFNKPLKTPYNPQLRYPNGQEVPARPAYMMPQNFDLYYVSDIKNYERRVADAIDFGYVFSDNMKAHSLYNDEKGFEMLAQIIEGNSIHPEYYGQIFHMYRSLLGHITDPFHKHSVAPSTLEHPETTLRDPAFYQIWKRVQHYFNKFQKRQHYYTREELAFDGVKIDNVDLGKLYTFFEPYEISVGGAVKVSSIQDAVNTDIRARNHRLNHKPFTYNIEVTSEKDTPVYVRVFLGPKYNHYGHEYDLNERRNYFVEIDRFPYQLHTGKNAIQRNSHESTVVSQEQDSGRVLYKKVHEAYEGKTTYNYDKQDKFCGLPEHLLIPKGKKGGQAFTVYVIVSPYDKADEKEEHHFKAYSYCGVGPHDTYPDNKPLGFPFDRSIHTYDFVTPNMFMKDVFIFHKKYEEVEQH